MNILHVIPSLDPGSGGPSAAIKMYARLLANAHEIHIAATEEQYHSDYFKSYVSELSSYSTVHLFPFVANHSFKYSNDMRKWLRSKIRDFDVVHIHAVFSLMSSIAGNICRAENVPFIIRPLGTLSPFSLNQGNTTLKKLWYELVEKKNLRRAYCLQATSESERDDLNSLGFDRVKIVPPFCLEVKSHQKVGKRRIRTVGYLGRIAPKKNLESLIKALSKSPECVYLHLAGNGDEGYVNKLKMMAEDLKINEHIRWFGFVENDQKETFFKDIDALILPSFHENFGIAAAEAMSFGIPLLLSTGVKLLDESELQRCSLVFEPTVDAIHYALADYCSWSDNDWARYAVNARNVALQRFSREVVSSSLLTMYQECAKA